MIYRLDFDVWDLFKILKVSEPMCAKNIRRQIKPGPNVFLMQFFISFNFRQFTSKANI